MEQIKICRSLKDVEQVALLADEIWHEYFPALLSDEQIDYMLEKFQSKQAIAEAVFDNGYRYYLLVLDDQPIGYCGVCPEREDRCLFLSKLYIKREYRGKGFARKMIEQVMLYAQELDLDMIRLTVNKRNQHAVNVYRAFGFVVKKEQQTPIGHGFIMDDYVLTLTF